MSRTPARHWSALVAEHFRPSKAALVEQIVARIARPVPVELIDLIRKASGEPPLPPVEERQAAERARLTAMSVEQIMAEEAAAADDYAGALAEAQREADTDYAAMMAAAERPVS